MSRGVDKDGQDALLDGLFSVPEVQPEDNWSLAKELSHADESTMTLFLLFGKPFGLSVGFWRGFIIACVIGVFMGFCGLGFFNAFEKGFELWIGDSYEDRVAAAVYDHFWSGEVWWILVMVGGGLLIGLIKSVPAFHIPAKPKGLFIEVKEQHVDPKEAPGILVVSCLSLLFGFSVGPEAALGTMGGAMGTLIAERRRLSDSEAHANTLNGMAGAMGSLLPSPILSVILLHELAVQCGKPPKDFMENAASMCVSAVCAWCVFYGLEDKTFLTPIDLPLAGYNVSNFEMWHMGTAALIGVIAGVFALVVLIMLGVFRKIAERNTERMGHRAATILLPAFAGLFCGIIAVALPLTLGDGTFQMKHVIGQAKEYGTTVLTLTVFAKTITLGISLGFGCIGGQIFPCIYMGTIIAMCCNIWFPDVFPVMVAVPCFASAVPGAFCPLPFSLPLISILLFILGSNQAAPVFLSTMVAFMTVCGTGCIQGLTFRGIKPESEPTTQEGGVLYATLAEGNDDRDSRFNNIRVQLHGTAINGHGTPVATATTRV